MATADPELTDAAPDFERSAALADDIAALRSRFPETRALYREVCGLLFFRYGITPTANKLYQLVRKGSMGTPAEVLQGFWQELRGRTRVTIDHPNLPDALKEIAAAAVQTIWQAANEAATGELATLRAEARAAAGAAEAERDAAHAETALAREEAAARVAQLDAARQAIEETQAALAAARQAHAATQARLEAGRAELEGARRQLDELRTQFSIELERAREQVTLAQERAEASERRSLRELDVERTARQQSDRTAEALRGELVAARSEARDAAVAQAEVRARLEAQSAALTEQLTTRLAAADAVERKAATDLATVREELAAAQRRAERAEAEALLARQLLAELRVAPPGRGEGGGGRRRKAGAPAPTDKEVPGEKLDEQQEDKEGVPTAASNLDDGSDSSDDSNDSKN
ncbi:DNA-binding protein [Cupriavidus consociatus]|uniref:DNA-binding protein n=1 Tax=Cupriavidus consociatus TaxID=2821357 RepID=UPI001AE12BE2|nr:MULTISPECIES: DNA-binding protein [unclassified Cupriavidus]MBP0624023.1 DNA-binding protein [Cupriavidus sp. LEh25]MDK2660733.1 DNA-binding protein [Cupriavidus sp. LEh21]